jgi:SAM-dependent methyltransferase
MSNGERFYQTLAEHYDELFPPDEETVAFLGGLITPTARVFDPGCGTGAHLTALVSANDGARGWGTDVSTDMVNRAQRRAATHQDVLQFARADMREANRHPEAPFDLVYCIGNTISHLPSATEVERWLTSLSSVVRPGGTLIIQFVDLTTLAVGEGNELPPLGGPPRNATLARRYTREAHEVYRFDARLSLATAARPVVIANKLTVIHTNTVTAALETAGFNITGVYGGFDPAIPPTPSNWVRVVHATRTTKE